MADINPNAAKLLRTTEEIVAQARLDQIAKDHKSIGSILDTRAVQPLEEVRFQTKKAIKLDIEKRLQARRGGRAEYDILSATNLAVEKFKEQGINVDSLTGNYELEEQIWKEKTRKLAYSQRRRFQQPLLHEFSQKMNDKQRAEYREKVAGALVELAEKYRKECVELKTEFDSSGIFHPEANAHRAHCMYLIKLNKGISADTIEDPVLKSMFIEHLKEERFKGVELTAGQKAFLEDNDPELLAEKRRQQSLLENKLMMSLQRRSTRAKLKPLSTHSSKNLLKSKSQKFEKQRSGDESDTKDNDSVGSAVPQKAKVEGVSPVKIFSKKLKHEKMGYMESRQVLGEEAQRLDRAEEVNYRKPRDKSDLLSDKLSSWMVRELQEGEVNKTAIGKVSTNINAVHSSLAPLTSSAINATITNFDTILSPSEYSVTKILPFNEFFDVIQNYQHQQQPRDTNTSPSKEGMGGKGGRTGSPKKAMIASDGGNPSFGGPPNGIEGLEIYSPSYQSPPRTAGTSSPMLNTTTSGVVGGGVGGGGKINMVQHLQQNDDQFNAYLKISQGEQLSNKLLSRLSSSLSRPRKPRRIAPLGRDAMALTDSRGKAAKIASKGFVNIFAGAKEGVNTPSPKKGKDEAEEEMEEKESDILTRLQGRGASRGGARGADGGNGSVDDSRGLHQLRQQQSSRESGRWRSSRSKSSLRMRQQTGMSLEDLDDYVALYGYYHDDVPKVSEEMECDLQNKIVAVWDSLHLASHERLTFMEKYSSSVVAAEMGHAIDMWAEVAALFLLLQETMSLNQKTRDGSLMVPIHLYDFLALVCRKLHPLIASAARSLTPLTATSDPHKNKTSSKRFPLSALALSTVRNYITQYFEQVTTEDDLLEEGERRELNKLQDIEEVRLLLKTMTSEVSRLLIDRLRRVQIELEDTVPYKNKPMREWLMTNGFYQK